MSIYYIKPNIFYAFKYKNILKINKTIDQSCNLIVIDNFYENPEEVRNFALLQDFHITGNFPGLRTARTFGGIQLRDKIQSYIIQYGYKFIGFNIDEISNDNGSFTLNNASDNAKSWIHIDDAYHDAHDKINQNINQVVNMAGVLYLSPNAPPNSGTIFYNFDYSNASYDKQISIDEYNHDTTKWKKIDTIGNVFNRLIIFNADIYHSMKTQFGIDKYDGRLTQNFFFTCEKVEQTI
jgi:hypothetical protein